MAVPENCDFKLKRLMVERAKEFEAMDIAELFEDCYLTDADINEALSLVKNATVIIEFH